MFLYMHSALTGGSRSPSLKRTASNHICQIAQADMSSDDGSSSQDAGSLGPPRGNDSSSEGDTSSGGGSEIDDQLRR